MNGWKKEEDGTQSVEIVQAIGGFDDAHSENKKLWREQLNRHARAGPPLTGQPSQKAACQMMPAVIVIMHIIKSMHDENGDAMHVVALY
jgi:hypothetical protein